MLERQYRETTSESYKQKLEKYLIDQPCEVCHGARLKPESLAVRMGPYSINDLTDVSIRECLERIRQLMGEGEGPPCCPPASGKLGIWC
jgi:excinuclease ABC subunit A